MTCGGIVAREGPNIDHVIARTADVIAGQCKVGDIGVETSRHVLSYSPTLGQFPV
jgi:hypothetical protein